MLIKISRLLLIALVIIVASIHLPYIYWLGLGERITTPYVYYSPVMQNFLIYTVEGKSYEWRDTDGKNYTRKEVDSLLPFFSYRMLASRGIMPDSLQDIKFDLKEVRLNNLLQRIRPYNIDEPQIPLYPLLESQPERLKLTLPESYFRITDKMEFIEAATNQTDKQLTQTFTDALKAEGFSFPSKLIFGNPTVRKAFDEGYFIVDNENKLFHIKMIKGKPFCVNTNIPTDIRIKALFVKERSLREFYGILITEDDQLYLLTYDNYRLQRLPVEGYTASENTIMFQGTLLYKTISIISENHIKTYVTNRKYELVDTYEESWKGKYELTAGIISKYIFPFTINLHSSKSKYVDFYISSINYSAIYANLFFLILTFLLMKRRKNKISKTWDDFIIVFLTGIYGFIAVAIFESTDT